MREFESEMMGNDGDGRGGSEDGTDRLDANPREATHWETCINTVTET